MRKQLLFVFLALLLVAFPAQAEDRLAWGGSMMVVGGGAGVAGCANTIYVEHGYEA